MKRRGEEEKKRQRTRKNNVRKISKGNISSGCLRLLSSTVSRSMSATSMFSYGSCKCMAPSARRLSCRFMPSVQADELSGAADRRDADGDMDMDMEATEQADSGQTSSVTATSSMDERREDGWPTRPFVRVYEEILVEVKVWA